MTDADPTPTVQEAGAALQRLEAEIRKAYIGQPMVVRGVLLGLLARGNLLLEGTPGLGKTLLVRVLAQALHLRFRRIQFTPDLMPADITGGPALVQLPGGGTELRFRPGPVFAHIVLADEVNRGTPKTQSALLEAMQEQSVTVAGESHALPAPFIVLATQNPIEMEGTYPLPEAQLDRFLFKLDVPFPDAATLQRIGLETTGSRDPQVDAVMTRAELLSIQALVREIVVAPHIAEQAAKLVLATHPEQPGAPEPVRRFVRYGASPRAMQALLLAGRAHALLEGRERVSTDDLAAIARPVLGHRIFLRFEAELEGVQQSDVVDAVLAALG